MNHELARAISQRLSQLTIRRRPPFCARLANENGWSRGFARRVIEEYERYLLLCVSSNVPACSSEHVDQAWHLHLTYTRSCWKQLCAPAHQPPPQLDHSQVGTSGRWPDAARR